MRPLGAMSIIGLIPVLLFAALACGGEVLSGATATPTSLASPASPTSEPASTPETVQQQVYPSVRTITVQAKADVLGREIANLFVNFSTRGPDVHTALDRAEEVNRVVRRVLDELGLGAAVHDENVSASPPFTSTYYPYSNPASAYRSISAQVPNSSDLSHVIGVLDEQTRSILAAEETINMSVVFDIEEGGPAEQYARSKAIAEARGAAEQIAQENGLTLGEIVSVVEGQDVELSFSAPSYGPAPAGGGGGGGYYGVQDADPIVTVTVAFAVR